MAENFDLDSAILYTKDIYRIREFYEKVVGLECEYQEGDVYVSFIFPIGYHFYEPYEKHDWGTYFAILDPDGNKIGFIQALVSYVDGHQSDAVTDKLNGIYANEDSTIDPALLKLQTQSLRLIDNS